MAGDLKHGLRVVDRDRDSQHTPIECGDGTRAWAYFEHVMNVAG
jgi:hypothetical protein